MTEHDVFQTMASRRTTRRFMPKPVEMDKLLQVVQAGVLAPSSGNIQNWGFTIVTDQEKIREMYPLTLEQEPLLTAPAAIIVTGDIEHSHTMYGLRGKRLYTIQNCAAAIENMLLAAEGLNLGACWIGAFDEDKISDLFEIPQDTQRAQAIILFGYPAASPEPKETKDLECFVFFNKFGNKVQRPHLVFYDWATEWRLQGQKLKAHAQNIVEKGKQKREERKESQEEPGEPALEQARNRMKGMFDSLKKERYRNR
ncbi:hypothetical protein GOV11_02840 [Candidatus Woesearchaeota archaeon]|nr:hypothetical protein [Candidatus Woesearchaeota archaeon]